MTRLIHSKTTEQALLVLLLRYLYSALNKLWTRDHRSSHFPPTSALRLLLYLINILGSAPTEKQAILILKSTFIFCEFFLRISTREVTNH